MVKVLVRPGDVFTLKMPWSEVCMFMGIAGRERTVRLLPSGMVQLLDVNGEPYSFPITHGEAGVYVDAAGYYVSSEGVL